MSVISSKKTQGFTLIELLISISLGIVAVSAIMFFYISTMTSSYSTLKASRLNQEMTSLMSLITNDIRRAGYGSLDGADASVNPFNNSSTKLTVFNVSTTTTEISPSSNSVGNCIVYSYDLDGLGDFEANEQFGYRFVNNVIQVREGVNKITTSQHCNSDSDINWINITDADDITIDTFSISLVGSVCVNTNEPDNQDNDSSGDIDDYQEYDCYLKVPGSSDYPIAIGDEILTSEIFQVNISIEASLTDDSSIKYQSDSVITLRNPYVRKRT